MSEERDLEPGPDDIDEFELLDDTEEPEIDDEPVEDEPEEPIDPRRQRAEQRRQEEQNRQQQRQQFENQVAQGVPQSAQQIREQIERLRYLDDDALNQHAQYLAQTQAQQRIFAVRDEAAKEAYAKEARRAGKTRKDIAKVEQGLAEARRRGMYQLTRRDVEIYLAGEEAIGRQNGNAPPARSSGGGTAVRRSARESEQERADRKLLQSVTWGDVERGYRR